MIHFSALLMAIGQSRLYFAPLTGGRRTALPRHQTLRAALDWSYELLPEPERCLLRRLGNFRGWVHARSSERRDGQ